MLAATLGAMRTFRRSSEVAAPRTVVWERVTSFDGINHELMPLMRMRVPRGLRGQTMATVPLGQPLGRAWICYLGLLPLEYDDLLLTEVVPGSHFHEVSTMLTMRRWEHRRELRDAPGGTEVTDTVGFEPRVAALAGVFEPVLKGLFSHRHRRLRLYFNR